MHLISLTPQLLGKATKCVDQNLLEFSGPEACKYFEIRRSMLNPISRKWQKIDQREREEKRMLNRYGKKDDEDEVVEEPGRSQAMKAAESLDALALAMEYENYDDFYRGKRRFDALFDTSAAFEDCFRTGSGPLGLFCCLGKIHKLCCSRKPKRKKGKDKYKKENKNSEDDSAESGEEGEEEEEVEEKENET